MATVFAEPGTDATYGFQFFSSIGLNTTSDTAQANTGPRSIKCIGGAQVGRIDKNDILADNGRRISIFFRFTNLPQTAGSDIFILRVANTSGSQIFNVSISDTGVLKLFKSFGNQIGSNGSTLSINTWYRFCLSYVLTSVNVNEIRLYLNENLDITVTNATLDRVGSANLSAGWVTSPGNSEVSHMDDIYVDDSSALTDTGDIRVTAKLPNAENVNNFDTAIGNARGASDFNNVNERALSETNGWQHAAETDVVENYGIQSATTGDVDLTGATLVARTAWIWAKKGTGNNFKTPSFNTNSAKNNSKTSGTTLALTVPSGGFSAGSFVTLGFASDDATGTYSVTDSASNTYTARTASTKTGFFTPAFVSSAKNQSKTSGSTLVLTVPAGGWAAGTSIIICFARDWFIDNTPSVSDTAGNTYTIDTRAADTDVTAEHAVESIIFSSHNIAALAAGDTITISHGTITARAAVGSNWTGLESSNTVDKSQRETDGTGTAVSGTTGTTNQADELIIGGTGVEGPLGDTFTKGTNDTLIDRNGTTGGNAATNITANAEYRVVTAIGDYTVDPTLGTSRDWSLAIATYKARTRSIRTQIFDAANISALAQNDTITITHPTLTARAAVVANFTGIATSPFDVQATATGESTSPSSGNTANTAQTDELLIGAIGVEGPSGDSFTVGTNYTLIDRDGTTGGNADSNISLNLEYRIVTATGAYSATGTLGTSRFWGANIAIYKATAATGAKITNNGTDTAITLTTTSSLFTNIVDSTTYPSNAATIGMTSMVGAPDTYLYECGMLISYIPSVGVTLGTRMALMGMGT